VYGDDPTSKQAILNSHPVPPRRAQEDRPEVPVLARIVWELDGEERIDTVAYASFDDRLVLVRVEDQRAQVRGYWLDFSDVERT
jgi:hypothetical protein